MSNWFANARRRLKNTVRGHDPADPTHLLQEGGSKVGEGMEMESEDSAWESGDEEGDKGELTIELTFPIKIFFSLP